MFWTFFWIGTDAGMLAGIIYLFLALWRGWWPW